MLPRYPKTLTVVTLLLLALGIAFSGARLEIWYGLLPLFEWLETTWFGQIGKTWGASFAVVEAFHLFALALLGGAVLVSDGRLLGILFTDQPNQLLQAQAHRIFLAGLLTLVATGSFLACAVALKLYYMDVFWYKMLGLGTGVLFVFFIKRPLISSGLTETNPWLTRLTAIASLMIWFTVAATGRWIGFS